MKEVFTLGNLISEKENEVKVLKSTVRNSAISNIIATIAINTENLGSFTKKFRIIWWPAFIGKGV